MSRYRSLYEANIRETELGYNRKDQDRWWMISIAVLEPNSLDEEGRAWGDLHTFSINGTFDAESSLNKAYFTFKEAKELYRKMLEDIEATKDNVDMTAESYKKWKEEKHLVPYWYYNPVYVTDIVMYNLGDYSRDEARRIGMPNPGKVRSPVSRDAFERIQKVWNQR